MLVNVSELLSDPEFVTTFTRMRPTVTLAHEGEASTSYPGTASLVGAVQPAGPDALKLLPEGTRLTDVLAIYTSGDITFSDLAVVDSKTYKVLRLDDFTGHGYKRVLAQYIDAGTVPVVDP